jgi:hypothetical protein
MPQIYKRMKFWSRNALEEQKSPNILQPIMSFESVRFAKLQGITIL